MHLIRWPQATRVRASAGLTTKAQIPIILDMSESLGRVIVDARKSKRYTLRGLAKRVGISPALLSLIERSEHRPKREVLAKLAAQLDGDVDQWAGLMGRITIDAEQAFATLAKEKPEIFRMMRSMLDRQGGQ